MGARSRGFAPGRRGTAELAVAVDLLAGKVEDHAGADSERPCADLATAARHGRLEQRLRELERQHGEQTSQTSHAASATG
eukprot:scaffold12102_cov57-Phaeocystis_antarctica.AAC.2